MFWVAQEPNNSSIETICCSRPAVGTAHAFIAPEWILMKSKPLLSFYGRLEQPTMMRISWLASLELNRSPNQEPHKKITMPALADRVFLLAGLELS